MGLDLRLGEIERRLNDAGRLLNRLSAELAAVRQTAERAGFAGGGPSSGGGSTVRLCKTTTAVTASSATAPGSGAVQPLKLDGSGDYANDGATLSVSNAGTAASSGKRGFAVKIGDAWWFTPEECES